MLLLAYTELASTGLAGSVCVSKKFWTTVVPLWSVVLVPAQRNPLNAHRPMHDTGLIQMRHGDAIAKPK